MVSMIPKERTVAALAEVWTSLRELLGEIEPAQWELSSPLPGWTVQDNVAHMIGTEAMLLGRPAPEVTIDRERLPHVQNDIGEFNEIWVESLRSARPVDVLTLFTECTTERIDALGAMSQEEWDAESFTPAGRDSYGRFMQIRVFDCWLHEQDIRDAVGRPGHETGLAVDVTLDELTTALGFVVGKRAGVESGRSVRFELTDGGAVVRTIDVEVGERARVVPALTGEPTVGLTMPVGVMTRLGGGRVAPAEVRDRIEIGGDAELGERVLANLTYTI